MEAVRAFLAGLLVNVGQIGKRREDRALEGQLFQKQLQKSIFKFW